MSSSPYINRFLSADTIVPGYANPQNLNRYSYVTNNPLRYTDPTGHMMCDICGGEGGDYTPPTPIPTPSPTTTPTSTPSSTPSPTPSNTPTPISTLPYSPYGPCIGTPISPGNFYGGYCGGGGGLTQNGINSVGGDGECNGSTCTFSGASVPLTYGASYDVLVYDNLLVVTLHEHYWMPGYALPLGENATFGSSTLMSGLSNGQQVATSLGNFSPGNVAHPDRLTARDTSINFYGKENFPTSLVIQIVFGAENVGAQTVYYSLPFGP